MPTSIEVIEKKILQKGLAHAGASFGACKDPIRLEMGFSTPMASSVSEFSSVICASAATLLALSRKNNSAPDAIVARHGTFIYYPCLIGNALIDS